jgi:hypothetical protein
MIAEADFLQIVSGYANGKLVAWFNNGCSYVVELNMTLPTAKDLRHALRQALAKDRRRRTDIVFIPFSPKTKAPTPVEVAIGGQVPLDVAQTVLAELAKVPDFPVALTLVTDPDESGSPRHVCVGDIKSSGKEAVPPKILEGLLDPKLSQNEFLKRIQDLP